MKFICDEMLGRLGRWLRAAGYDTLIVTGSLPDREVLAIALEQHRLLVTRDRHFLGMKGAEGRVIWLQGNRMEECAVELSRKGGVDWLYRPFTRCMLCNQRLSTEKSAAVQQVPEKVLASGKKITHCSACGKNYWLGSHTEHMRRKFAAWNA